ncbi:MAG: tRNA pseudouridine(38-40) synthase TruA [Clostridia bacterium]|nr:tRNA pseudouridine(38-40) synthase TruA [Clostridia bacterium]
MKILLRLSFVGTDFCGWQFQPHGRSVQKVLTDAAAALLGTPCEITGCSRTDSGVHALDFAATLVPKNGICTIPLERLPIAFSHVLPSDLSVKHAESVPDDFHPRYAVVYKEYIYRILPQRVPDPFLKDRAWQYPRTLSKDALTQINAAAEVLVGKHDFSSFMAAGSKIEDPVRTVKFCFAEREGEQIVLHIAADGFLYHMVRIIAGTLMLCAEGKADAAGVSRILEAKNRAAAGVTAPPAGLYLYRVVY